MSIVTFLKDVHIVDQAEHIDRYFNFGHIVDVTKEELALVDAYAKKWALKGEVYVKEARNVFENVVGPNVDSPSHPDNQKTEAKK